MKTRRWWIIAGAVGAVVAAAAIAVLFWPEPKIPMPSVMGITFEEAKSKLSDTGFRQLPEEAAHMESWTAAEDTVCWQSPSPGTDVPVDTPITLKVALAPPLEQMPDQLKVDYLKMYAPQVYLHAYERYYPSSVEWSFRFLTRKWSGGKWILETKEPLPKPSSDLPYFAGASPSCTAEPRLSLVDVPTYAFWHQPSRGEVRLSEDLTLHDGDIITLMAEDGTFLKRYYEVEGHSALLCPRDLRKPDKFSYFTVEVVGPDKIRLIADDYRYLKRVCCWEKRRFFCMDNYFPDPYSEFRVTSKGGNRITLQADNGEFLKRFWGIWTGTPFEEESKKSIIVADSLKEDRFSIFTVASQRETNSEEVVDLVYFFYYPYNRGKEVSGTVWENHVGDWEHVTVRLIDQRPALGSTRLKPAMDASQSFCVEHHGIPEKYAWKLVPKVAGTNHPIAFAAEGSHGMWLTAGDHTYNEVGKWILKIKDLDDCCDEGTAWDTWTNLECFDYDAEKRLEPEGTWPHWLRHDTLDARDGNTDPNSGPVSQWGNNEWGRKLFGYSQMAAGPTGPLDKTCWGTNQLD